MTIFARSRMWLAGALPRHNPIVRVAVPTAVLLSTFLLAATPASAVVTEVGGTSVGLQVRNATTLGEGEPETFANESGHAVLHGTSMYVIYWDPTVAYHHEWLTDTNRFFQNLGDSSGSLETIFSATGQYRDRSNTGASSQTVFKGNYSDTVKYPAAGCTDQNPLEFGAITCLTDAQLRTQLQSFVAANSLPTGMHSIFYLLTPPGVTVCLDAGATHCSDYTVTEKEEEEKKRASVSFKNSFCSYHGDINPDPAPDGDGNTVLYAAIPWTAGDQGLVPQFASSFFYEQAYDCQDGGWNPEGNEERREKPKPVSEEEEKILKGEKGSPGERADLIRRRELEEPHLEEPNQEGKGEFGDYSAGLSDLIINQIAEEQANTVTDPMLNGWTDAAGYEVTDICRNVFANTVNSGVEGSVVADTNTEAGTLSNSKYAERPYYVNNVFSLSGSHCVGGTAMVPRFTLPDPVNNNEIVGFNGMESSVGLAEGEAFGATGPPTKTYATFSWNFGDGTPEVKGFAPGAPPCEAPWLSPCAASTFHSYTYGGSYPVTLTITDVAGNVGQITETLTVDGPLPPPPPPAPGSTPPAAGTGAGTGTGTGNGSGAAVVNPIATAGILSRSLRSVVRNGLVVRYSVNEQVAGHFEVLISKSLARHLKLVGTPATGLPVGTPPEVVIGKAVLVTTKAGQSTMNIKLSRAVAARLGRAHSAPVTLRLTVRNAASKSPATVTVISSAKLG